MGERRSFKERQRERVLCPECGKDLVKGSMMVHRQTQNGVEKGGSGQECDEEGGGNKPRTFIMAFYAKSGMRTCPIEGCSGQAATRMVMQVHFWHRNIRDNIVILEEVKLPQPR